MTIDNPTSTGVEHHMDAVRSALRFLRSPGNPYASSTDSDDIGLVGHSLGAAAVSYVQASDPFVKAVVGLDDIRALRDGDADAHVKCQQPSWAPVIPSAPALGEASEASCTTEGRHHPGASSSDFTDKRLAFKHWREQGVASMETVMKGFKHATFGGLPHSGQPLAKRGACPTAAPRRLLHASVVRSLAT